MATTKKAYHLFEVVGIELEYMIVHQEGLQVLPIADQLLHSVTGNYTDDVEIEDIAWSNELALHVIELKTNGPAANTQGLAEKFHQNIKDINQRLSLHQAMLLPTAMHPLMNPLKETKIWPHSYREVYELYNKIFDCRGHGWSNLQSMHINLPFANDEEFGKLHAAIRLILPIIPALAASSPLVEGRTIGLHNARMKFYMENQAKIPSIMGDLIPEPVFAKKAYEEVIYHAVDKAISPYDPEVTLERHFLNSRGAIARFDRGAVEIRVTDLQESPVQDIAIADAIIAVLQYLVEERWQSTAKQMTWDSKELLQIFKDCMKDGELALIRNTAYLSVFGFEGDQATAQELWAYFHSQIEGQLSEESNHAIRHITEKGTLSTRILKHLNGDFSGGNIKKTYQSLAQSVLENKAWV